jgi:hypothetical protein
MRPWIAFAILLAPALIVGCADPEPAPPPPPPTTEAPPPPPATEAPPPGPVTERAPQDIIVTQRAFEPQLLEKIRLNDLIEVILAHRGGRTRGIVKNIKSDEVVLAIEGTQIVTRLRPDDVRDFQVVSREDDRLNVSGLDEPRNDAETWLDRFAARTVLQGQPVDLWGGRHGANTALPVTRPFTMIAYNYASMKGGAAVFTPSSTPATLREGDSLKLVGVVQGLEQRPGTTDRALGEINLYLLRRGAQVQSIYSPDLLHPSNLDRAAVAKFLEDEPVTLSAYRVGQDRRYVRISRIPTKTARTYMLHLERTPERSAVRAWRAQGNAGLADAEKAVRALYKAIGLTNDADLETPVVFEMRTISATGGLRLLSFRKELGMD